jgi:hypothetical protein
MNRRNFIHVAAAAGTTGALASAASPAAVKLIELRYYRMRNANPNQVQRTSAFLQKHFAPAAKRAGIAPLGFFTGAIAENSPSILVVKGYASFEAMGAALEKLASDKEYGAAFEEYNSGAGLNYVRIESSLLRAFDTMQQIDFTTPGSGKPAGAFELRTYESDNAATLKRKIGMFEQGGEIDIFRKTGVNPVFFGETIVGRNMPNLTYMVAFEDMAARAKAWGTFGSSAEWQKLRAQPGLSDAEVVSNISNSVWSPMQLYPAR